MATAILMGVRSPEEAAVAKRLTGEGVTSGQALTTADLKMCGFVPRTELWDEDP